VFFTILLQTTSCFTSRPNQDMQQGKKTSSSRRWSSLATCCGNWVGGHWKDIALALPFLLLFVVLSTFFQLTAAAYESHVSHNQPEQQCDQIFTIK
jgi:hypothetical protein